MGTVYKSPIRQHRPSLARVKAMAVAQLLIALLVQICILFPQTVNEDLDAVTRERMLLRERYLNWQMNRLLLELEQEDTGPSIKQQSSWGALLLTALQQWHFWITAGVLVWLCWWLRTRMPQQPGSHSEEGTSQNEAGKEEQEEKASPPLHVLSIPDPLIHHSALLTEVQNMLVGLVRTCNKRSENCFMPQLQSVISVGSSLGGLESCEEDSIYDFLVPLSPPQGHTFHLDHDITTKEMPGRNPRLRVELECTCTREFLSEEMLCFLHHPEEELRECQAPSLLETLCTGPYLDIEKTVCWFQSLITEAWPDSRYCTKWHLTLLHSRFSSKFHLTDSFNSTVLIHIMFGVRKGGVITFLSTE